ncbi:TonB system transport protein ExbD [Campylobacter sp. FMV-PI01]|uniref:Biopolymer transport protein ExbD n=1 Tax=Campylobacter portucalensis TaxID=2608384 RepID=A0A6L5WN36_9BACT|nr:TonB system transport protein ExbD [Campylobacter portucalensis]MSN97081.1 TonB system transport protein ExbD [Campylobacter portucalensis]
MKLNKKDGLNVVPFIDIMLVLLAIVLSISTFIAQGKIQVNLPKAPNATKSTQNDIKKVTILVNSDNEIYIDDNVTTPQELSLKLKDILKEDTLVVIKNDKDSKFDMFIKVIDVLKELKHEKFSIITQTE